MSNQITVDGATTIAYEQVERAIELDGIPISGYSEATGGGEQQEGRVHVFDSQGRIVTTTNGRTVPQNKTMKMFPATWSGIIKPALLAKAAALGITKKNAYMFVEFTLVDQWQSLDPTAPSYTERQSFKINKAVPDTPNDGNMFQIEIELFPTTLPVTEYN